MLRRVRLLPYRISVDDRPAPDQPVSGESGQDTAAVPRLSQGGARTAVYAGSQRAAGHATGGYRSKRDGVCAGPWLH